MCTAGFFFRWHGRTDTKEAPPRPSPLQLDERAPSETSQFYSKAYVRHLFHTKELLGPQIASIHNLSFFLWLVKTAREHILSGDFDVWKKAMMQKLEVRL